MGLFDGWCQHDWEVKAKTFMPPRKVEFEYLDAGDVAYLERCSAGVTTVLLVCGDCGKTQVREMLGKEVAEQGANKETTG